MLLCSLYFHLIIRVSVLKFYVPKNRKTKIWGLRKCNYHLIFLFKQKTKILYSFLSVILSSYFTMTFQSLAGVSLIICYIVSSNYYFIFLKFLVFFNFGGIWTIPVMHRAYSYLHTQVLRGLYAVSGIIQRWPICKQIP